jgi:glycyl-tRNA synthetase
MEKIVSLCKRRGFIFQASEIYGGLNGVWDYGPLGVELKRNLKDYWWRVMVRERDDVIGMDGAILTHRAVLKASGHEDTFVDMMRQCSITNRRVRADQVEPQSGTVFRFAGARGDDGSFADVAIVLLQRKGEHVETIRRRAKETFLRVLKEAGARSNDIVIQSETTKQVENSVEFHPETGGELTAPRPFNLMFKTYVGATEDESALTYLRPETAQSIFVQFKNVLDTSRQKLPFGIAQIGKAFRNEINPRNYIFRSREFEQMELEYFCRPKQGMDLLAYWLKERLKFYQEIGIARERLHVLDVPDQERAFYSKGTFDIEYDFPFGRQELEGVAYRTDYDLMQHQTASGKSLEYFDEGTKQKFIPHVVEPSAGVDRTVLALICEAYAEDQAPDEKGKLETRVVMRFHPRIAPIKCAIFPLLKNKEQLVAKAKGIVDLLRPHMNVFYDESGAIGRRYRRQDEAGTPFGLTIDFETLGERDPALRDTVTLRDRDSMKQERVKIADLPLLLLNRINE